MAKDQVLVINNCARPLQIQVKHHDPKFLITIPDALLVDKELWEMAEKNPIVQSWKKLECDDPEAPKGTPMITVTKGLPALSAKDAEAMLRQIFDLKLLDRFAADETRADVRALIQNRAGEIQRIKDQAKQEEAEKKKAAGSDRG